MRCVCMVWLDAVGVFYYTEEGTDDGILIFGK